MDASHLLARHPVLGASTDPGPAVHTRIGYDASQDMPLADRKAPPPFSIPPWYTAVSTAAGVAGAYHGYKRNKSVLWAVLWSMGAGLAPFIAAPVALAQGFGKPKKGK